MSGVLRRLGCALAVVIISATAFATAGSFRGYLIEGADTRPGWMYVQGKNDTLRLVKLTGASVTYADEIPANLRHADPHESLQPGAEVRVLAEQDRAGNWRAQEIEILRLSPTRRAGR